MTCHCCSHHGLTATSFGLTAKCKWEDVIIIIGLLAVQISNATYMVFVAPLLSKVLNPFFLVCFGSLTTAIFILPFAISFERVTAFQVLMMIGMKRTSPAIASALPNLAPGIIFIIAACFRIEKVDLMCFYTRAKILGTLLCLGGAIVISFLQIPSDPELNAANSPPIDIDDDWIIGCLCLLTAVLVVSCCIVLQGSVASSICVAFSTWAVKIKGPVTVCMFNPICTVGSAILSAIYLHQIFRFGRTILWYIILFSMSSICTTLKRKQIASPSKFGQKIIKINNIFLELLLGERI
ncbi:hypothetical protein LUZ61_018173 [Rhynchospora tenuis]|uniref:WAT1-related protein n=1 Tax=Rhynchospora tenuis TaxID=198213 RepID=A0AAD5Z915_9POAL|nr:hypothetical protein LUZ61_018173 [Rhynchospora tenuis]